MAPRLFADLRLINGSTGDPVLYVDSPGTNNALLFDAGDNSRLELERLADLNAVFITHHPVDHFIGLDRIVRANIDADKTLCICGPAGTIRKVYDRIRSYEYQFFPFQKIVLRVEEIGDGTIRTAHLECTRRFPEPEIAERAWSPGAAVFQNDEVLVEATPVDHVVPCLAYALVQRPGFHVIPERLDAGLLRPGPWIGRLVAWANSGAADSTLDIQGGRFSQSALAEQYLRKSRGTRIAFVTDTRWNDISRPGLLRLASGAQRLYCDAFYAEPQARQAEKYGHMTAPQTADFALQADVAELVLMHFSGRYAGNYQSIIDEARAVFPRTSAEFV